MLGVGDMRGGSIDCKWGETRDARTSVHPSIHPKTNAPAEQRPLVPLRLDARLAARRLALAGHVVGELLRVPAARAGAEGADGGDCVVGFGFGW